MNEHNPPGPPRTVILFREGRSQTVHIPAEFELPGTEATIRKDGDRLILEPKPERASKTFSELIDEFEPIPDFPDLDDGDLLPLRDVKLE